MTKVAAIKLRPPCLRLPLVLDPFDHGAVFYLNFDHLNIGSLANFRFHAWWVMEAIPNVLEEAFLSTFGEVMLLSLM